MKFRFLTLVLGIFLIFSALIFNLYQLQIKKNAFYLARAQSRYLWVGALDPRRGVINITDKNGALIPAAFNKDYPILVAAVKEIGDIQETAGKLAQILGINSADIQKKLSKSNDVVIAEKITDEALTQIKEAALKGIHIEKKDFRFYPLGSLAANVLGYVGFSNADSKIMGRYGVEAYYNEELQGAPGSIANGNRLILPKDGVKLNLTIDRSIQNQAEEILNRIVNEQGAVGGSIIVQEPQTGKILAMANNPSFNPNVYSKSNIANFLNPNIQALYEPGSVFKVITMAAGIDTSKITPDTSFTDKGFLKLNGKTISNYNNKAFGLVTMTNVIENSINTGAAFAVGQIGHDDFYNYVANFGFREKTGITLPGEVRGNLRNLKNNPQEINFATAAFGQGIAVTPLEMINAVSAIANGGALMRPYLLADAKPQLIARVIKPSTADAIAKMMIAAVVKGQIAMISNYQIAGKTGTAQIADLKNGGYTDEFIHTFVGFAPVSDPKFTILVKIDKPKVGPLAGMTVVPAFHDLAQFILNYYNIPPDDLVQNQK